VLCGVSDQQYCFSGHAKNREPGHLGRLGNGDHDFAAGVAGFDMTNSFCYFGQRIGSIDHGAHFPCLNQIGEKGQIFAIDFGEQAGHFLIAKTRPNCVLKQMREQIHCAPVGATAAAGDVCAARLDSAQAVLERSIAYEIKEQIVALGCTCEILMGVVDHFVGSDRPEQFDIPGAAHPCDMRPKRFSNLQGKSSYAARCAIDENGLSSLNSSSEHRSKNSCPRNNALMP